MAKVLIDPLNRIEGHLSIELDVAHGKVQDARARGDMFRGFENLLKGRNPVDSIMLTQRICGVCPISHAVASSKSLESAFSIRPSVNGNIARNLILASNYFQSHIVHFYHLSLLDYVDVTAILKYTGSDSKLINLKEWAKKELETKKGKVDAITSVSPFLPRYEGKDFYIKDDDINIDLLDHYLKALEIRRITHEMASIFGGKIPHSAAILPGGVSQRITQDRIEHFKALMEKIEVFIRDIYRKDVVNLARLFPAYMKIGKFDRFLAFGVFESTGQPGDYIFDSGVMESRGVKPIDLNSITEHVRYARYSDGAPLHPFNGETNPDPNKKDAYSWVKAPRYNNRAYEVGPMARLAISYTKGNKVVNDEINKVLVTTGGELPDLYSTVGRHIARAVECGILFDQSQKWLDLLKVDESTRTRYEIPQTAQGVGITEAPRGALGHWITIKNHHIENYQTVVPTTWNTSPRDNNGVLGAVEQALIGTPVSDTKNPIEAARVVRSFDPCLACAIHTIEGGKHMGSFKIS